MDADSVKISSGVAGILLGPGALVAAAIATVAFMLTPLPLAGVAVWLGCAFAIGVGVGVVGVASSVWSLRDGTSASLNAPRRRGAIGLGIAGIVLCSLAIVLLVALWLWLPSHTGYAPLWS
jgi:hypothetical protein